MIRHPSPHVLIKATNVAIYIRKKEETFLLLKMFIKIRYPKFIY